MTGTKRESRRLMIVDDDLLSREVLGLLAGEAGFEVVCHESGETALAALTVPGAGVPDVVLTDMQMPGVSGNPLAQLLRNSCGSDTRLLAMSATSVTEESVKVFDAFLLKPFSIEDLCVLLDGNSVGDQPPISEADSATLLNPAIFAAFSHSMSPGQVRQLYKLSLDDAEARIKSMRTAAADGNDEAYRMTAHSIKGGCGMVGAVELAGLATTMEEYGLKVSDFSVTLDNFCLASQRLRRILDALLK